MQLLNHCMPHSTTIFHEGNLRLPALLIPWKPCLFSSTTYLTMENQIIHETNLLTSIGQKFPRETHLPLHPITSRRPSLSEHADLRFRDFGRMPPLRTNLYTSNYTASLGRTSSWPRSLERTSHPAFSNSQRDARLIAHV